MASSKIVSRLSSRLNSLSFKLNKNSLSPQLSSLTSAPSSPTRRLSLLSRLPVELSSVGSMLPLHSAIASSRLVSSLSSESESWGLVPQGISMPL
ncbi:protein NONRESPONDING TO OXYLIPINS 2, mitochondrial [Ricinus communis]|uniref:protein NONRESPONDING TO OXYLIPINS 2, mitochondrial n=1 Tax=Ricinus communis TaxID=3988 RepID=UPI0007726BC7|nr:protein NONRESPONDING TO OXYLIPINS 2, mitochondrial [Ricinus communis]|eukprot:XP_015571704.1 uncharacterized protein LOC8268346 [Ricinus communis]